MIVKLAPFVSIISKSVYNSYPTSKSISWQRFSGFYCAKSASYFDASDIYYTVTHLSFTREIKDSATITYQLLPRQALHFLFEYMELHSDML